MNLFELIHEIYINNPRITQVDLHLNKDFLAPLQSQSHQLDYYILYELLHALKFNTYVTELILPPIYVEEQDILNGLTKLLETNMSLQTIRYTNLTTPSPQRTALRAKIQEQLAKNKRNAPDKAQFKEENNTALQEVREVMQQIPNQIGHEVVGNKTSMQTARGLGLEQGIGQPRIFNLPRQDKLESSTSSSSSSQLKRKKITGPTATDEVPSEKRRDTALQELLDEMQKISNQMEHNEVGANKTSILAATRIDLEQRTEQSRIFPPYSSESSTPSSSSSQFKRKKIAGPDATDEVPSEKRRDTALQELLDEMQKISNQMEHNEVDANKTSMQSATRLDLEQRTEQPSILPPYNSESSTSSSFSSQVKRNQGAQFKPSPRC